MLTAPEPQEDINFFLFLFLKPVSILKLAVSISNYWRDQAFTDFEKSLRTFTAYLVREDIEILIA